MEMSTDSETMNFTERLRLACQRQRSHLCVGLDPDYEQVMSTMRRELLAMLEAQPLSLNVVTTAQAVEEAGGAMRLDPETLVAEPEIARDLASELVVRATAPYAAAFKPNAAFFELQTGAGVGIPRLVRELQGEQLVIFDGKRGDIGNSSRQYATAIFEAGFDAATVNPLMGHDAIEPFLERPDRGAFLLCVTSNPGAADFLLKNDLYLKIAEKAVEWNRLGNVGLVVGATRPEIAARVREVAPNLPLLIPGIGAQEGDLEGTLDAIGARENPLFLVNASRSIMFPPAEGPDIVKAIADAARQLRDAIRSFLNA
jgi:orotidine-5'-phosphate decarboxylase